MWAYLRKESTYASLDGGDIVRVRDRIMAQCERKYSLQDQ